MAKVFIGTSGWIYSHWEGIFYPEDLPSKEKLKHYSSHFKTAEINYSFYHLPRPSTYQNWYNQTPKDFIFAVKASRFITHIKRLEGIEKTWQEFINNALHLKEKLGPILFQFPPSFKASPSSINRLETFLKTSQQKTTFHQAVELRDRGWCKEKVYSLLKKYNVAWVIADSPRYPKAEVVTADFVYIRMHGSKVLFASKYTKKELSSLAQKVKKWLKQNLNVYCYFNNDAYGFAIENAKELSEILNRTRHDKEENIDINGENLIISP